MTNFANSIKRWVQDNKTAVWAVLITLVFTVLNSILIAKDLYLLMALPLLGLLIYS